MDTLLQIGLSNALAATLLAVPVALVARVWRRPALAHALWLLVLLKLVTPPLFWVSLPWPDPLTAPAPVEEAFLRAVGAIPQPDLRDLPPLVAELPDAGPVVDWIAEAEIPEKAAPTIPAQPAAMAEPIAWPHWENVLPAVWLLGTAFWWAVVCVRVVRFRRLLRYTTPATAEVQLRAEHLAARLGLRRCPGVWLVTARISPLLWAVGWTPRLLLPTNLWQSLTPEQRDTLLLHELAHLRRRDHWVRRLELVVLGLFWWHPVGWWARHELAEAEEACCDAWVVWALPEAGPSYAAALVQTLAFLSLAARPVPVAASGAGRTRSLKRRLFMILQRPSQRGLSRAGLFAVLALAGLLPLLPTWAQQQPTDRRADAEPVPVTVEQKPDTPRAVEAPAESKPAAVTVVADPPQAKTPASRERAEQIEKLRDEVEILEAQIAIKRAQLNVARAKFTITEKNLARIQMASLVSQQEIERAKAESAVQKAQVAVAEAELLEPEVRLRQVRRRLAALEARTGGPARTGEQSLAGVVFLRRRHEIILPHGGMGKIGFRMMNRTKDTVHISAVRTSSGAITASPSVTELAPGKYGFINVSVDGRRFTGAKTFTVWVVFDRPQAAEVKLQVHANAAEGGKEAVRPIPKATDATHPEDRPAETQVNMLLKKAFGGGCPECKRAIKLLARKAGLLIAADEAKIMKDGSLRLAPCSIARLRPNGPMDVLRASVGYLSFDRKLNSLADLGNCRVTLN